MFGIQSPTSVTSRKNMGRYIDFNVRYDPETESQQDLMAKILYSIIINRLKHKKPVVMFISGDSGEGKSLTALRIQELLLKALGLDIKDYLEVMNVFTPLEYSQKLDQLLYNKELKKVPFLCMHEARNIVKAKEWQSFLNQAIADVNAMSRAIKPLCFIVISQFIRDINTDIRYTLNYYCDAFRPLGSRVQLSISKMWKDTRDLEKPKLRKRRLKGFVQLKGSHKKIVFSPRHFEMGKPDKEIVKLFEKLDFESKGKIIRRKMDKLLKEMGEDMGEETKKTDTMAEWYMKNQESLLLIGKRSRGKWKLKPEVKIMHGLTDSELKDFQQSLNEKFKVQEEEMA